MRYSKVISNTKNISILIVIVLILIAVIIAVRKSLKSDIELTTDNGIEVTAAQIESIRQIGEWEFLSINTEEMVDTVRHGIFSDDELIRIYYGTVRLGIDLSNASDDWIKQKNDTLIVKLPRIKLLDKDLIDETLTQSFLQTGKWTNADREALAARAYQAMLKRSLTKANIATAEQNGINQFKQIFNALGVEKTNIYYEKE